MCGLVGIFSSNMFQRHKVALEALLYLDTWRGRDSTGVAAIRHNADTAIMKSTVPGYEFVEGDRLNKFLYLNDFCWIGHNRHGTIGRNTKSNAHPFEILDAQGSCLLVGAHNGTLKNKHILKDHNDFGTDSEALFSQIAHTNIDETINQVDGAWALTWYDHVEEELRFLRNNERTLFYAYEEDKKTLIWASERWMINIACSRAGMKLHKDEVFSVAEDTLYRFPAPNKMNEEITFERKGGLVGKQTAGFFRAGGTWRNGVWEAASVGTGGTTNGGQAAQRKAAAEAQTQTRAGQPATGTSAGALAIANSAYGNRTATSGETQQPKNESSSNTPTNSDSKDDKVVPMERAKRYKNYGGKLMSAKSLKEVLDKGCGWCEIEGIEVTDQFGWLTTNVPICAKCLAGEPDAEEEQFPLSGGVTVH